DGKVAIVTGAAHGIGAAYARHLASLGATVVVADLDEAGAKETTEAIGAGARAAQLDIADPEACAALADSVVEHDGRIDVLVNNAAIYRDIRSTPAEDIPIGVWRRVVD